MSGKSITLILLGEEEEYKPQVKSGWGLGGTTAGVSSLGMKRQTNAEQYWDNKTTELVIPEMDADGGGVDDMMGQVAEPPKLEQNMANLRELEKEIALNVPTITQDGVDISLLTSVIRPIADLIETDMNWDYNSLQAEIGQNYREKYTDDTSVEIEGTRANNI